MRTKAILLAWAVGAAAAWAADPVVSNVRGQQRAGTGHVDVTYDLTDSDTATLSVTVEISTNGGAAFFTPSGGLSGDVGGSVARGTGRKIVWNAGSVLPAVIFNNVRARVTATDNPAPAGMVLIPAGSFAMGDSFTEGDTDEQPVHTVSVSAFYIDKTEVTKAKWDEVYTWATANGYGFDNAGSGKAPTHPVQTVNWYDCVKWCNARSQKEGLTPCYTVGGAVYTNGASAPVCNWSANGYRLPTEAEWEKAARGGAAGRRFPWADSDLIQHTRANYYSSTSYAYDTSPTRDYHPTYARGGTPYTSPVGSFAANGYGLFDMAGNVWEWCWDWYSSSYYGSSPGSDPRGATTGSYRVGRGGCWDGLAEGCRSAYRVYDYPSYWLKNLGFRSVRPPGQ